MPYSSYGKLYRVALTILCTYNLEKNSSLKVVKPEKGYKNDEGTRASLMEGKTPGTVEPGEEKVQEGSPQRAQIFEGRV